MFAVVHNVPMCVLALLAAFLLLGVRASRPNVRFETGDPDVIEEVRLMVEADREARHLAIDAPHLSGA